MACKRMEKTRAKPVTEPQPTKRPRKALRVTRIVLFILLGIIAMTFYERALIYYPTQYPNGPWYTDGRGPCAAEDIYFTAEDGTKTHGWWLDNPSSKHVLVYFHGNAGSIADRYEWGCQLTQIPASVLMVEYRGYGKSEGTPEEHGIYQDARAVWTWLTETRGFEASQIILYGKSLGGAPATDLAAQHRPLALVLQSTFTSIPDMAKQILPWVPKFLVQTQFDNERKLPNVQSPVLIIHSRADDIVPFFMSEANARAAANLSDHLIFEGYGHNDLVSGRGRDIVAAIAKLIN